MTRIRDGHFTEYVVGVLQVALCVLVTCGLTDGAAAAAAPSLTVTPRQVRTRAAGGGLVPAWDTSWWVTIQAQRAQAPLTRLEYTARFTDSTDRRALSGGWDLSAGDAEALSGRLLITCAARPDYDRHVRVQLRIRDALGATSEWVVGGLPGARRATRAGGCRRRSAAIGSRRYLRETGDRRGRGNRRYDHRRNARPAAA